MLNFQLHSSDIKDVVCSPHGIFTCGRDGSIKLSTYEGEIYMEYICDGSYINSLVYSKEDNDMLIAGTQKGNIYIFTNIFCNVPIILPAHKDNVCSLAYKDGYIVSGSWDKTVVIYNRTTKQVERRIEHPAPVWKADVQINTHMRIITCTTDGVIRIIEHNRIYQYNISIGCIRSFITEDNKIYVGCNDGKIIKLIYSMKNGEYKDNYKEIKDRITTNIKLREDKIYDNFNVEYKIDRNYDVNDFIYSMGWRGDNIMLCMDGRIIIIDKELNIKEEIKIEGITIWKVVEYNNILYICGSNGKLYIYNNNTVINKSTNKNTTINNNNNNTVINNNNNESTNQNTTINNNNNTTTINNNNNESTNQNIDNNNNESTNQNINNNNKYKVENNKVYELINNEWILIGTEIKEDDEDYITMDIDLSGRTYNLKFLKTENYGDVAERFLNDNKLSLEYKEEIVEFLENNLSKKEYKKYKNININKIKEIVKDKIIIEGLEYYMNGSKGIIDINILNKRLEILYNEKEVGERYPIIDIVRYLVLCAKGINIGYILCTMGTIEDRKESEIFVRLVINMYNEQPIDLEQLKEKIEEIKDRNIIIKETIDNYYYNRSLYYR